MPRRARIVCVGAGALLVALGMPPTLAGADEREAGAKTPGSARHSDPVIQAALDLLGQSLDPVHVATLEEVRRIYSAAAGAGNPPPGLNAFRAPGAARPWRIYVNAGGGVYRNAKQGASTLAVLQLAASLVHEQVHRTDGESAAYRLQSDFVRSRLRTLPRGQREAARRYLASLETRARAFAYVERRALRAAPAPTLP